jgi:hypothetical protein
MRHAMRDAMTGFRLKGNCNEWAAEAMLSGYCLIHAKK